MARIQLWAGPVIFTEKYAAMLREAGIPVIAMTTGIWPTDLAGNAGAVVMLEDADALADPDTRELIRQLLPPEGLLVELD
jgi:hypothetical protein